MIPVQLQPEPPDFEQKVRIPGQKFLQGTPKPKKWKNKEYWTRSIPDLYIVYDGICAYSGLWLAYANRETIDHFLPKSKYPDKAYEWNNFRLAIPLYNENKGVSEDILDPFKIEDDWFILEFPDLTVKPNPHLSDDIKEKIRITIKKLKLNEPESVEARSGWLFDYIEGEISFDHLISRAPFIAYELKRQNLIEKIFDMVLNI